MTKLQQLKTELKKIQEIILNAESQILDIEIRINQRYYEKRKENDRGLPGIYSRKSI